MVWISGGMARPTARLDCSPGVGPPLDPAPGPGGSGWHQQFGHLDPRDRPSARGPPGTWAGRFADLTPLRTRHAASRPQVSRGAVQVRRQSRLHGERRGRRTAARHEHGWPGDGDGSPISCGS